MTATEALMHIWLKPMSPEQGDSNIWSNAHEALQNEFFAKSEDELSNMQDIAERDTKQEPTMNDSFRSSIAGSRSSSKTDMNI